VRSFQNGGKVCNLRIATSETWKDRNSGERQERTEWHSVAIFSEGLAGVAERFLRKGSKVYIEGQLRTRKWQDQSGNDRYSTEVVLQGPGAVLTMLDGAPGAGGGSGGRWLRWRPAFAAAEAAGTKAAAAAPRAGAASSGGGWNQGGGGSSGGGGFSDDLDDDIPF
jgi:single-strand DNA-binding protein